MLIIMSVLSSYIALEILAVYGAFIGPVYCHVHAIGEAFRAHRLHGVLACDCRVHIGLILAALNLLAYLWVAAYYYWASLHTGLLPVE